MQLRMDWIASEGSIWHCTECGRLARYKAGFVPGFPCSRDWDETCFLHAELIDEKLIPVEMRIPKK